MKKLIITFTFLISILSSAQQTSLQNNILGLGN